MPWTFWVLAADLCALGFLFYRLLTMEDLWKPRSM